MIVDELLKSKSINFRQSGKDYVIRCLNPEHEDRNPSLRIDRTTGIFNCLSCGFKGDIFVHFEQKPNALQLKRERLKDVISSKLIETLGYDIPDNAVPFTRDWRGISGDTFKKFGAFQHNNSEYIGRVVIPLRNITGKIVAFCGRHQGDAKPKYLFHPRGVTMPLFPSVKPIQGKVILVEGIMDMLNLHDKGLTNAICNFGVGKLTEDKINILKIQGISGIDIFFDNDKAGQEGAEKNKAILELEEIPVRNLVLPSNLKDPGELTASQVIRFKEILYG
jgi:DNA primase